MIILIEIKERPTSLKIYNVKTCEGCFECHRRSQTYRACVFLEPHPIGHNDAPPLLLPPPLLPPYPFQLFRLNGRSISKWYIQLRKRTHENYHTVTSVIVGIVAKSFCAPAFIWTKKVFAFGIVWACETTLFAFVYVWKVNSLDLLTSPRAFPLGNKFALVALNGSIAMDVSI